MSEFGRDSRADPLPAPVGVVLAAGAGTRFGGPKVLARDDAGTPWVERIGEALRAGGCAEVVVVVGAAADEASDLVAPETTLVRADRWRDGVSASVRAGLDAVFSRSAPPPFVLITTVDVPDLPAAAVSRVIDAVRSRRTRGGPDTVLAHATYDGRPGHPVAVGRAHWAPLAATLAGDRGARAYLVAHGSVQIECGDLWSGDDVDRPSAAGGRQER